ncbi:hypothetical protein PIROE2DRAFT_1434 [Piromyces sp. E2]|nr:hypothetical protein PIROE2DRAFT_1434 [Piromyces sp. E2]|eukprot:OUM70544.1 hypothetical protein PIROE2DRAFT_1434 [Piromyces sp. E2]
MIINNINGERAELFELLDNEMPTLRISISNEEFIELKDKATYYNYIDYDYYLSKMPMVLKNYTLELQKINYNEVFPGYNFNNILPQLQMGEDGFAKYDYKKIITGFDYDMKHYDEGDYELFYKHVLGSNKNFNLLEIIDTLKGMNMSIINNGENKVLYEDINKYIDDVLEETEDDDEYSFYNALNNIPDEKELHINSINTEESLNEDKKNQNEEVPLTFDNPYRQFKTKNATMNFELNGINHSFKKVTFSISGRFSRSFSKPNYNLKIRGGKELYGRSQFKLRADSYEPTYLRTKLVSDIHNRLNLKSVSANYVQLYINDEYMGLYIITDALKLSWIENVYGEKDSTTLYNCKGMIDFSPKYYYGCINENEEFNDKTEWMNFLNSVENAKSASDLEDIFEIDQFLYEMALEYLLSGDDHFQSGHNYFLYKQPNGKWIYLSYDFDLDFGYYEMKKDTFENTTNKLHIIEILILQDSSRFEKILKDIINRVYNPSILYPHIDEIKQFIKPYVKLDKTVDSNGQYPGRINKNIYNMDQFYTMEQWDAYSEYTNLMFFNGLKYWILMTYRNACKNYNMECDPIYMDENYEFPINEDINNENN